MGANRFGFCGSARSTKAYSGRPVPAEVWECPERSGELVNMAAYGHVTTVLIRDGRRLARIVPEEDAWIYSPAWQESSARPRQTWLPDASSDSTMMTNSLGIWMPWPMRQAGEIPDHGGI